MRLWINYCDEWLLYRRICKPFRPGDTSLIMLLTVLYRTVPRTRLLYKKLRKTQKIKCIYSLCDADCWSISHTNEMHRCGHKEVFREVSWDKTYRKAIIVKWNIPEIKNRVLTFWTKKIIFIVASSFAFL